MFLAWALGMDGLGLVTCVGGLVVGLVIVTPELFSLWATEERVGLEGLEERPTTLVRFFFWTTCCCCLVLNCTVCFTGRDEAVTF